MKNIHGDRQRHTGEPCTSYSYGTAFATTARRNSSFTALSSVRRMVAGDRETAAAAGTERLESSESVGRSAELEVLIHCEGWSTARRALNLVDQRREVVVAEGEEI